MFTGISLVLLGLITTYFSLVIKIVRPPYKWVIEYNGGSEIEVWDKGIHFLWIPIDMFMNISNKIYCADKVITLQIGKEEGLGNPGKIDFTDASAAVVAQIILKVNDPKKATYNVDDYEAACINRVESELRKHFGGMSLDDAMAASGKKVIAGQVFKDARKAISKWGVILNNPDKEIAIIDFDLDEETEKIRREVLSAEKQKRVAITLAEGKKQESILHAEGEAQAEWGKIKVIAEKLELKNEQVIAYLLTGKLYDAMEASTIIATSEGGSLNAPVNIAATMGALQSAMSKPKDSGGADE